MRGLGGCNQPKKRKKRIDVEPGCSVADAGMVSHLSELLDASDVAGPSERTEIQQDASMQGDPEGTRDEPEGCAGPSKRNNIQKGDSMEENEPQESSDKPEESNNSYPVICNGINDNVPVEIVEMLNDRFYVVRYNVDNKKKTESRFYVGKINLSIRTI